MRVVAGKYAGLTFSAPKSVSRPTTDRVKESIFQALDVRYGLEDRIVLDVFAGSGALTFEALSRGSKYSLMNDQSYDAVNVLQKNCRSMKIESSSFKITKSNALKDAFYSSTSGTKFDLVFLDPPYDFTDSQIDLILTKLIDNALLDVDALIYIESATLRQLSAQNLELFEEDLVKSYGNTVIQIFSVRS